MMFRILAAAALATLTVGAAHAGTITNGVWAPSGCKVPGEPPAISGKSPEAYNASAKTAQAWQASAKEFADCVNAEAKTDQNAIVSAANDNIGKLSKQIDALNQESNEAVEKLKSKTKK
jgi:gas vesicle protein